MKTENINKMNAYGLRFAAGLALLLAAASCTGYDGGDSGTEPHTEPVETGFSMKIRTLAAGDDATYSLLQTGGGASTRTIPAGIVDDADALIKNLWVIQFESGLGNAAGKKMVGVPRFISGDDLDGNKGTVQLIGTTEEEPCYIVWVANHPLGENFRWNLPLNATFADVASRMMQIVAESDTWPEIDGDRTILMNAITETPVRSDEVLEPVFNRNYARVSLKLTLGVDDCRILSVRLRNVPTSVTLSELALGSEYTGIVPSATAIYPYGSPMIDYETEPGGLENKNDTKTFTWYVPRNQQGRSASPSPDYKNYYAPVNATYFEVIAQRKSDSETAVFRVYPGANQSDDYTLLPNHAYTSSLNVKGIGNSNSPDSRVENFDDVEYNAEEAANCYILNPAPVGGRTRKYTIPITQAVTYWKGTDAGYGNLPANVINAGDPWEVTLLWSDDAASTALITFDNSGTGPDAKFSLYVPSGLPACNFTVKLTRQGSATVLWSWHFWVTDYNPDAFRSAFINLTTVNPAGIPAGTFTYPVPNGQVERYAGDMWTTGAYKDKVMMDRSLGALENYFTEQPVNTTRGHLFYQFGRKDPFPAATANSSGVANLSYGFIKFRISAEADNDDAMTMVQAVLNPNHFYNRLSAAGTWCTGLDGHGSPGYVWFDPRATINNTATTGMDYNGKSIYDPCPPGWKLPARGTWSDFSLNVTVQNTLRDLGWSEGRGVGGVNALRYWPGGAESPVGGNIYYAASGQRVAKSGGVSSSGTNGYLWAATPYNATGSSISLTFGSNSLNGAAGNHRAIGLPVRCVSQ